MPARGAGRVPRADGGIQELGSDHSSIRLERLPLRWLVVNPYDRWHYPTRPFRSTRIDCLELTGWIHGFRPTPATAARVLEIGCGTGGNLLPMAEQFPGSTFVGIDLAASQIAVAEQIRQQARLDNVRFEALDLCDVDDRLGSFDYIIAHGVYSWVPQAVKARLLDVIGACLTPNGIAYVSHNVKPGWFQKAAARDFMRYALDASEPADRVVQARQALDFLAQHARGGSPEWQALMTAQAEIAHRINDEVVHFDHLADVNDACYLYELAAELPARSLEYLADASYASMMPNLIPAAAVAVMDAFGDDLVRRQQYLDFLKNRTFRMSLLVRCGGDRSRSSAFELFSRCRLASAARPAIPEPDLDGPTPVSFRVTNASARVARPLTRRALVALGQVYPQTLTLSDLASDPADRSRLAADLLQLFGVDLIELWAYPDSFARDGGTLPRAGRLARVIAERDVVVPNRRHESQPLRPEERQLIALLDGTRDLAALVATLPDLDVPGTLCSFGTRALLEPDPQVAGAI
jgi:SAM-dependent methyltransferase